MFLWKIKEDIMNFAPERRSCHSFVSNIANKRLKKINKTFMDGMLGFAAGVMIAASFWLRHACQSDVHVYSIRNDE